MKFIDVFFFFFLFIGMSGIAYCRIGKIAGCRKETSSKGKINGGEVAKAIIKGKWPNIN